MIALSDCDLSSHVAKPALLLYDAAEETLPNFGRNW